MSQPGLCKMLKTTTSNKKFFHKSKKDKIGASEVSVAWRETKESKKYREKNKESWGQWRAEIKTTLKISRKNKRNKSEKRYYKRTKRRYEYYKCVTVKTRYFEKKKL